MSEEPNYPIMVLEAENDHLKDEIIKLLKSRVDGLENEVAYLRGLIKVKDLDERDVGSNMIVPPSFNLKPKLRTISELAARLENRSLNAVNLKKSAEEVSGEI